MQNGVAANFMTANSWKHEHACKLMDKNGDSYNGIPWKMKMNEVLTAATTRVNLVDMRSETSHKEALKRVQMQQNLDLEKENKKVPQSCRDLPTAAS